MGKKGKAFLQPIQFRRTDHVAIICPNNPDVDEVVRDFEGAEWSTGYRFWHMPVDAAILSKLIAALKKVASVDANAFENFVFTQREVKLRRKRVKTPKPNESQLAILKDFEKFQIKTGYSEGTIKIYVCLLKVFVGWHGERNVDDLSLEEIKHFLNEYIGKNNFTENYRRLMENAIRRYYIFRQKFDISQNM